MPCFYFVCTIAGLADPLLSSPNATMGDRGSEYKAATNISKNIVEYFLWSPIFCHNIEFSILILPLMPQGEYKAVAIEENQAFEMTVSWKNHQ